MEKKRELIRLLCLGGFLCAVLIAFFCVLYNLQVVRHEDFQAKTVTSVGKSETVPAARGEILDRYGRSMVTNQVVYQVTLDTSLMGDKKNQIILELIRTAEEHGVTWSDSLPLSREGPFTVDLTSLSEGARERYSKLSGSLGWESVSGQGLLLELRKYYKLDETLSDREARQVMGVLYELSLRQEELLWSSYVFASGVDIDFISAVRERGLTGVNISPVTTRKYATTCAAHLLGRTGRMDGDEWRIYKEQGYAMDEIIGKDGAERAFESYLRGESGTRVVERNTSGKIVGETWKEEPEPGNHICLTIDLPLQEKLEQVLAEGIPNLPSKEAEGGAGVMIDVNSGAILAAASYPTYDLTTIYQDAAAYQEAVKDPLHPFNNRAFNGLFAPGSTFKPLTAIAALEEGIITPTTKILDTGRYNYYSSRGPACWIYNQQGRTHGSINVTRAIEVSCNVFFYDVGRRLGIKKLGEYAERFGLGQPTGVELPEETGVVAGPRYTESQGQTWYEGSVLSAAIGQENNQFTPLQLANYTATLANGGTHYAAHLLKSVKSNDYTQIVEEYQPQVLDVIEMDPDNLAAVKQGMLDLTQGSLARYFKGLDMKVGAKTGSAEVSAGTESNAVFVCFAPYDDPQVAMAFVVEHGGTGSELAAFAAEMLSYYFTAQQELNTTVAENTLLH